MKNSVWKKTVSLCLSLAVATSLFVGCGENNASEPSDSSNATAVNSATTSTDTSVAKVIEKSPEEYNGKVIMWGWDEKSVTNSLPLFNKVYPNIKLEFVNSPGNEYLKKVQSTVAAGMELPDIMWQNMQDRGSLYAIDGLLDDLSADPYNVDKSQIFDFGISTSSDAKGRLTGIPWDMGIGGLMYRRDLTKQYFGTDDPAELTKMFTDWNSIIEKGKEVKQKSNGKVFMFAGLNDIMSCVSGQNPSPISDGGNTFNFDSIIKPTLVLAVKARDAGIADKMTQWTPGWNSTFADGRHIFFSAPMWGPRWMAEANDKDGKGRWGLMQCPEGAFNWGGTALGIPKNAKNKEVAWQFIKWFALSMEGANYNKDNNGYYINFKPAFEDAKYISRVNPFFADQDLGLVYKDIAKAAKIRPVTKFDNEVLNAYTMITSALSSDTKISLDSASNKFKEYLKTKFSDIEFK